MNVTLLEGLVALVPASLLFSGSVVLFRSAQTRPVNQLPRHHHEPQVRDPTMHSFYSEHCLGESRNRRNFAFFSVPWGLHVVRSGKSWVRNISSLGFWRVSPAPLWPSPRAGHLRHLFSS